MSEVLIGAGRPSTGMAFIAPKGTALPTTPGEELGAEWVEIGAVGEDGCVLTPPNGDVLKNWALVAERKINTENGKLAVPFIYTNDKVLGVCFGDDNVEKIAADSTHGNILGVTMSPDVSADAHAFLFLMKDGDKLGYIGSSDALITEIADVTFNGSTPATWNTTIDGTWTFKLDDGQIAS